MKNLFIFLLVVNFIAPGSLLAHPGRTDSSGCHSCRTNCSNWGLSTGEYHCHNAKAAPQPLEPVTSTFNEDGVGLTIPALEYKKQPAIDQTLKQIKKVETIPVTTKKVVPQRPSETQAVSSNLNKEPVKSNWVVRFYNWLF